MKAGFATVNITPPIGVELAGFGFYLNRRSTGIRDELYSKALVLDDGENKAAIVANDLLGVDRKITSTVRRLIEESTDIPGHHVLVAYSHTHSGPATVFIRGCGKMDEDYLEILPRQIAGAVIMADAKLQATKVGGEKGSLEGVSYNRAEKGGPVDPDVGVIRVDGITGKTLGVLVNFGCHPTVLRGNNTLISRDFPGRTVSVIETVKTGATGMFLQGSCGDVNPIASNLEQPGVSLGAEALKTAELIEVRDEASLKIKTRSIKMPVKIPSVNEVEKVLTEQERKIHSSNEGEKRRAKFYVRWAENTLTKLKAPIKTWMDVEIQLLRIADVLLVAAPLQIFTRLSLDIKARSPFKKTFIVGCANDHLGYLPDKEDFDQKGYAAVTGPMIRGIYPWEPSVGKLFTDSIIDLINAFSS